MDYDEAKKEAMKEAVEQPHMKLKIGTTVLVLPHKQGLECMKALELAEELEDSWSVPKFASVTSELISASPLSHKEYCHLKMAQLLDVSPYDIQRMEREKPKLPKPDPI